jgi:hypothetical protein
LIDVPKKVIGLFDELISRGEEIKNTCKKLSFSGNKKTIDPQTYEAWKTSCLTLLRSTFGTSSPHYDSFANLKFFDFYNSTLIYMGILQSAREDVLKGYFYHKDLMLSVNIFASFLGRAKSFEENGRREKALAILETVAQEALKKLAESKRIPLPAWCGIAEILNHLTSADALSEEIRQKIGEFERYLDVGATGTPQEFTTWNAWLQKFIYENLGSQIVILN